jgi:hypothetical protein
MNWVFAVCKKEKLGIEDLERLKEKPAGKRRTIRDKYPEFLWNLDRISATQSRLHSDLGMLIDGRLKEKFQ